MSDTETTETGAAPTPAPSKVTHLTMDERAAHGRAARADAPRTSQGTFDTHPERDPVAIIDAESAGRVPELVPIRYGRMLVSPFTFYRGAAAIMAHDLSPTPRAGLKVQLCGDAHISNFGGFAAPDRTLVFDLNDFDESAQGPFEWDVKRLATSIEICGRDRDFSDGDRKNAILGALRAYRNAMRDFAVMDNLAVWYSRLDANMIEERLRADHDRKQAKVMGAAVAKAQTKDSLRALSKLTHVVDGEVRIISDPPLIVPIEEALVGAANYHDIEHEIHQLFRGYRRSLQRDRRKLMESFRIVHLARKVVGVGSVGTRAWIVLLLGRDDSDPLFLQIKEAQSSVLEPYLGKSEFNNHGQRVVEGQRMMQAASVLPRLDSQPERPRRQPARLLRPPAVGLEDVGEPRRDSSARPRALRGHLRLDARARPRPFRRPGRDRVVSRQERRLRSRNG